ncbi:MAG TPA: hypothetical protein VFT18_09510, partial [Gaiellaceae bacterium]|nr:hypothetical protein [Gaiellaceae bacterium]
RRLAEESDSAFLRAQLRGLETVARKLAGEQLSYDDEVEGCYGTRPERVPEEQFEAAHRALDEALPPGGTLGERYQRWEDGDPLPADRIEAVLRTLGERLRVLAQELIGLPEGETFELELVTDKHWIAYNHYLGGLRSRIDANTDLPITAQSAAELIAHELYPGHHTEHAWKELLLYEGRGQLEESVLPYGTPQSVIGEGIATLAVETVVDDHGGFVADVFGELGIAYDAEAVRRVRQAAKPLNHVLANAAILLHVDGVPTEEAKAYVRQWMLASEQRAQQYVDFVTDPWGRAYIRTYTDGNDLCRNWVAGDMARFRRLLTEQLTPADLT